MDPTLSVYVEGVLGGCPNRLLRRLHMEDPRRLVVICGDHAASARLARWIAFGDRQDMLACVDPFNCLAAAIGHHDLSAGDKAVVITIIPDRRKHARRNAGSSYHHRQPDRRKIGNASACVGAIRRVVEGMQQVVAIRPVGGQDDIPIPRRAYFGGGESGTSRAVRLGWSVGGVVIGSERVVAEGVGGVVAVFVVAGGQDQAGTGVRLYIDE